MLSLDASENSDADANLFLEIEKEIAYKTKVSVATFKIMDHQKVAEKVRREEESYKLLHSNAQFNTIFENYKSI